MDNKERISARAQAAKDNFKAGYNCSQSVALAFADLLPIDKDTLLMLASPFGGGMARMREVCGAVSGMFIVEGLLLGYSSPTAPGQKSELYAKANALGTKYAQINGSVVCREILSGVTHTGGIIPEKRTDEYYKKRPCADLVYTAAEILAEHLCEQGIGGI